MFLRINKYDIALNENNRSLQVLFLLRTLAVDHPRNERHGKQNALGERIGQVRGSWSSKTVTGVNTLHTEGGEGRRSD